MRWRSTSTIFAGRIDSRFLLPGRRLLPHVNCYPPAELRGAGEDGEATEHGNTAGIETVVGERYRTAGSWERRRILDEFTRVTGYHRKHALRVLHRPFVPRPMRPRKRIYDEAVREALVLQWEAADRICGKRLKALLPVLIESMERHGHLRLDPAVRSAVLDISAATIDRLSRPVREATGRGRRRRWGVGSALRQGVPIRTFADSDEPPPGYCQADLVEHCGGAHEGNFVHSLTLIDIHSGWTEGAALVAREQTGGRSHQHDSPPAAICPAWARHRQRRRVHERDLTELLP